MDVEQWLVLFGSIGLSLGIVSFVRVLMLQEKYKRATERFYLLEEITDHLASILMRYDVRVTFMVGDNFKVIYMEDVSKKESE